MIESFDPTPNRTNDITTPGIPILSRIALALTDRTEGLDLNHWRPDVPLRQAKRQGIRFILTKASQGDYFIDETYQPYREQAQALGLPLGPFHYWDAAIDPIEQAAYFYAAVNTFDKPELLPVWDIEKYGNEGKLSQPAAAQHLSDGLQETAQRFGREVMVYTSFDSWQVLTGNSEIIAAYPLWVANWTTAANPMLPAGAEDWVFWQDSNQYKVEGYSRGLDHNRFNGNESKFEDYVRSINGQPPPNGEPHTHPALELQIEHLSATMSIIDQRLIEQERRMADISAAADGDE